MADVADDGSVVPYTPIQDELLRQLRAAQALTRAKAILAANGNLESNIGYPSDYWKWMNIYRQNVSPL